MDARESKILERDGVDQVFADIGRDESHQDVKEPGQARQALQDIAFGSAAGIVGKYIEYPFDTVKVRLQSQPSNQPLRYAGPLDCFRQSVKHDGIIGGLYRGISAPLVGAAIETSSLFFSYRLAQDALQSIFFNHQEPLPMPALCLCGAISGACTSLLLTPIELVKCKMQVPQPDKRIGRGPGPFSIIASVFYQGGIFGFWRGQLGTLIRETGGSAAWFGSYEGVSLLFRLRDRAQDGKMGVNRERPLPVHQQLLAGAVAGMSYNFVFYPADTVKSRMQTEEIGKDGARLRFLSVGRTLFREHGVRGLYRGCGITVGRAAPSSALIFTVYEGLKNMLR